MSNHKETRQNTYSRIINTSLKLFNEQGERNISTNHIATTLNISPGNLYYHFKNKDEIIIQLFKRYSADLMNFLNTAELPNSIAQLVDYMMGIYNVLWNYRFLFSDVNALLNRSRALLGEHADFTRERFSPLAIQLLKQLQSKEIISIDDVGTRNLTVNLWVISKYWFDFDSSVYGEQSNSEQVKARGVYRSLSLIRPHLKTQYLAEFDAQMALLDRGIAMTTPIATLK